MKIVSCLVLIDDAERDVVPRGHAPLLRLKQSMFITRPAGRVAGTCAIRRVSASPIAAILRPHAENSLQPWEVHIRGRLTDLDPWST